MPPHPTEGKSGSDWDYAYTDDAAQEPPDDQLLGYADSLKPGRALDLGCGTGGNSVELARRGWKVVGVDIATKAIEIARAATDPSLDVIYEVGDMTDWKTREPFDIVLVSYALPSEGPRRKAAIGNARDALVSGGTLIIGEFDASSMSWGKPGDFATIKGMAESLSDLDVVTIESVATKPHHHGEHTSHDSEVPKAVIALARKF